MKIFKTLPLTNVANARDLGGFPTIDGGVTRYGVFIRSAAHIMISKEELDFLSSYGVTLNIDFRHDSQIQKLPSPFASDDRFRYVQMPVYLRVNRNSVFDDSFCWGNEYPQSVDANKEWIKKFVDEVCDEQGGCIFNCATGKDRTGVMSAILLLIAGVKESDIIADYAVSEIYLRRNVPAIFSSLPSIVVQDGMPDWKNPFFRSDSSYMSNLLSHISTNYHTIDNYLASCGIEKSKVDAIRNHFVAH